MPITYINLVYIITKANWGGAQRYIFDIIDELVKRNRINTNPIQYKIAVIHGKPKGELSNRLEDLGINTIYIPELARDLSLANEFKSLIRLIKILKNLQPDIIHLNSSKVGGIGGLAGRIVGVKNIIFTAHGWAFNEVTGIFHRLLIKAISWVTIMFSHKVIVLSRKELQQVHRWPLVNNKKLTVIYNGINDIKYLEVNQAHATLSDLYNLLNTETGKLSDIFSQGKTIIGTIAELHKNKGLYYAINAFSGVCNAYYIIIGDGEEMEPLKSQVKMLGLGNKVLFLGHIDNADRYLKAFDIILLPSLKEGFPYVLLEASRACVPIIATRVGGVPELVSDGHTALLTNPGSESELLTAIHYYINHNKIRTKHAERQLERLQEKFVFARMLARTVKLYHGLTK